MGYDVSYHPISPTQMVDWYSASLASDEHARAVCDRAGMHELYKQKFLEYLPSFRDADAKGDTFDRTHGFFIAITQGFFGRFHYVRGAMLSELGEAITPYTQSWSQVLPELVGSLPTENRIVQNYSSGVYVTPAKVGALLVDVQTDPAMRAAITPIFPGEHLSILVTALHEAEQLGVGLLEATDMIEPNPLDLESTHCLANLFNCDTAGPMLYQKTANEQFAALGLGDIVNTGNVERIQISVDADTGEVSHRHAPARTASLTGGSPRIESEQPRRTGGLLSRLRRRP